MNKSVLCFLTVVIVSARCSAESIPALNKTLGIAVAHSTHADGHDKQNNRVNNEAPYEERGTFAIESFASSVKIADESLPDTIHAANMMDVLRIKERNKVLATRMEELGINIDSVVVVTKALKSTFKKFSLNNLEWMVLGKVYFEKAGGSTDDSSLLANELFKEANMEITDNKEIIKWTARIRSFHVRAHKVFGKMRWLMQHHNELNLYLADAAKMAFGSEYLNIKKLPSSDWIIQAVGEQNVDKDLVESLLRQDKDAQNDDRGPFAIESFASSVKIADESLPDTIHAANMMDVLRIKERNKVLATRMEELGINIDSVVVVTKALKSTFKKFSLNNLEWMVLGKVYFEKAGSSTGYSSLLANELFKEANMEIIDNEEIIKWTARFHNFQVRAQKVFGKMLWLIQHHNELNIHLADAAKMAFGSEYLNIRKLPSSNWIIQAVGKQNVDKDLVESLLRQDKNARNDDQGPFAIESFTTSVKIADESLPDTIHAANMMDVSQIKERNKVLATQMEELGISIDGVLFVTNGLKSEFKKFSLNNLQWMVLGKLYFEKAGGSTDYSSVRAKRLFKEANIEIIDNEEIIKWTARIHSFHVGAKMVMGKMLWLIQNHNELNLYLADAAKMAFGSEYLKKRKLKISDSVIEAVTEQDVVKDGTESLIRQDTDSIMKDIAGEKLLKKATRKYVGEESQEQPNKNRKLA